jgi:hypothetical protein
VSNCLKHLQLIKVIVIIIMCQYHTRYFPSLLAMDCRVHLSLSRNWRIVQVHYLGLYQDLGDCEGYFGNLSVVKTYVNKCAARLTFFSSTNLR